MPWRSDSSKNFAPAVSSALSLLCLTPAMSFKLPLTGSDGIPWMVFPSKNYSADHGVIGQYLTP